MTVRLEGGAIRLVGACYVEDAEVLLDFLQRNPGCGVDLTECQTLHTAVLQILVAFKPPIVGEVGNAFLRERILPVLLGPVR